MSRTKETARSRARSRERGRGVPFLGSRSSLGPLTDHLQFFADYENWTSGDPLPNRWTNNSGITSLADNNTVQSETGSPLVGSKSGDYVRSNGEYHSGTGVNCLGKDFYISAWVEFDSLTNVTTIASQDALNGSGDRQWGLYYISGANAIRLEIIDIGVIQSSITPQTSTVYFVEAWATQGNNTLHIRINDGTEDTVTGFSINNITTPPFFVGERGGNGDYMDGRVDYVVFEVAPQGELQWPSASTWLYNGGNARTWDEIQTYQP